MSEEERERRAAEHAKELCEMQKKTKQNADYVNRCKKYFDMTISDNLITCHVLQSVDEFYEEGTAMHHCVYANRYYEKQNSLILSARIDNKRIETVEVDLQQMKVVQCYGACDKFTLYHDRIVSLVNDNMNMIKECMTSKQIAI
nr:MAG TPA: PcfJ-like protein [Caudoviricetes sp.]